VIETFHLVGCSGPCGRYLACSLGDWIAVPEYEADSFTTLDEAERASAAAGWTDGICSDCQAERLRR
jgi:hypothetical protein